MKVLFFHNVLWAHYKGAVFTELYVLGRQREINIEVVQIAETTGQRSSLTAVDTSFHQYPYTLLFKGSYDQTRWWRRAYLMVSCIRSSRPDVVVLPGYYDRAYWASLFYCMILGIKRGITMDSTIADHPRYWLKEIPKRIFLRGCNFALCYGTRSKEYLRALGMAEDRLVVRCQAAPVDQLLRSANSLTVNHMHRRRPFFLYVGRFSPEKGLDDLLRAFSRLCSTEPEYDLVLVGSGPDHKRLEGMVAHLDIHERVEFAGALPVAEVVHYYMAAYSLVLPSLSEPWGLVVNEAFLFGCPAVVSDRCGCVPDLIPTPDTGVVFPAGDVHALETALGEMIRAKARRGIMADACKALISSFTPQSAARQMLDAVEKFR